MADSLLNIAQLADAAGISTRAVRFYIQQRLLPAPLGVGRGDHYDESHLTILRRIAQLQQHGHSLAAIRQILEQNPASAPATPLTPNEPQPTPASLTAGLYSRLQLAPGIELHFDASKYAPQIEGLLAIRQVVRAVFGITH